MMPDEDITVLVLNGIKKVINIKINRKRVRKAIFAVSLFAVLLLVSIGFNIYQFINDINYRQMTAANTGKSQEQSPVQIPGKPINPKQTTDGGKTSPPSDMKSSSELPANIYANDHTSKIIGLQDLSDTLQINGFELKVAFSIVNNTNQYFSGKFIIIAKTTDKSKPFISYPNLELNSDGTAVNFRHGENFAMQFLTKQKVGTLMLLDKTAKFEYYRIQIYSDSGELLLQKTQKVKNG